MARNKVFRRKYIIEFKGITTNDFMSSLLDKVLKVYVEAIAKSYRTVSLESFEIADTTKEKK